MPPLPAIESGQRLGLAGGAGDLDHRNRRPAAAARPGTLAGSSRGDGWLCRAGLLCRARAGRPAALGRLDPRRLVLALGEVRRPWRVRQPGPLVVCREFQQGFKRVSRVVDSLPRVADLGEPFRHGPDREGVGVAAGYFVPSQRRRNPGLRNGPDGICTSDRSVLGVLVVVDEDAVPFLLPPPRGRELGRAPFDLSGQGHSAGADLGERPAWLDSGVDVEAAGA
jgi:hypothetical protein